MYLTPSLILRDVLDVPKLSTSLVSIQKLTKDLKCYAIFYPSYCAFQDQCSRRKIGLAKERNGLYYLATPNASEKVMNKASSSFLSSSNKDTIWLHHFRLGHPSFRVLDKMVKVGNLVIFIVMFVRLQDIHVSHPFDLVYSDIWGS